MRGGRRRALALGGGLIVFIWLRLEENSSAGAALMGTFAAVGGLLLWLASRFGGRVIRLRAALLSAALVGGTAGSGAAFATALLMLLKNGSHGHVFPDYPPGLILATLERAPVWTLAGGCAGLGLTLVWIALRQPFPDDTT